MPRRDSFTRYLVEKQRVDGRIPPQLRLLLEVVARACKRISFAVSEKKGIAEDSLFFDDDAELDEDADPAADAPENSSEDDSGAPDSGNAATE